MCFVIFSLLRMTESSNPFAALFFWIFFGSEVLAVNGFADSQSNVQYFLYQSPHYPRDCQEAVSHCSTNNAKSGVYLIKPDQYPEPFEIYCDNNDTSAGWTVIQRRYNGFLGCNRNWNEFKHGFGFLESEFWIGNEKLAHLTNQKRYMLLIKMENTEGQSYDITYDSFRIADEWGNYSISSLGTYDNISEFDITHCVTNKQFKNGSICERSCENPNECVPSNSKEMERCICPENYMINEDSCIPTEQCSCYVSANNIVLVENESFINSACSWRVTCINNNLINETYSCSNDATCQESNGAGICICNQWFIGDGTICTRHPCYDEGKARVLAEGESYINSVCSSRITCSNNRLTRADYECHNDATCEETNGVGVCNCDEWFVGNGVDECTRNGPRDCSDLYRGGRRRDKVYTIYPRGSSGFNVFCEMSDGGWTIVQKRTGGSLSFHRRWNDYKNGFGNPGGDHWLGNDRIHKLTSQDTYQLRIEKTNNVGASYHTRYSSFSISNEAQKYRLSLGTYHGNDGNNAMGASSGYRFSTHDRDYDGSSTYDCAEKHRGGWWYPDDSSTGTTDRCYSFSNRVATGRYSYSDCVCYRGRCCNGCVCGNDQCCDWGRRHYKCSNCAGCSGYHGHIYCGNRNPIYETTYYSCGYSNLNGDYQLNDYRGIFWKNIHGSDCGITETTMKIRTT